MGSISKTHNNLEVKGYQYKGYKYLRMFNNNVIYT